jgi:FixJ family two-component response regulator
MSLDLPIIFITAHEDRDARAQAVEAGALAFLYKPFDEQDLLNAINVALEHG